MGRTLNRKKTKSTTRRNYGRFQKVLVEQQEKLTSRVGLEMRRMFAVREPEDEGGVATDNYAKDLTATTLERERRTLSEIKEALARLHSGEYGICEICSVSISDARLEALPWAKMCVNCAENSAAA
jgi:DnaK suppressor protein